MTLGRRTVLGLIGGAAAWPALAATSGARLVGQLRQGGLVVGRAEPGAAVVFEGRPLRVSPNGFFALGFGRDHAETATLVVTPPGGAPESRTLGVARRDYKIQRIDGLPDAMVSPPADVLARIKRENALIGAARARDSDSEAFTQSLRWPVVGPVTGVYGSQRILNGEPRRPHFGIDIAAAAGTPIEAPLDAVVTLAEADLYYTGGTVILDHGHGVSTTYLHLSRLDVTVGDALKAGEVIGAVGATGRATGPHLCWRLNWFQERLDPELAAAPRPAG